MPQSEFSRNFTSKELLLLKVLVFCLFIGRAWQGLFWDLPLRTFFWDQSMLEGIVTFLTGDTWQSYVTNKSIDIDSWINRLGAFMGFFWLFCAMVVLKINKELKWGKGLLYTASFSLFILALLYFKDKFWDLGQLFEYSLQVASPIILAHAIYGGANTPNFRKVLKPLIAITFICHGLYAYGYYPRPGLWVQWTMDILMLSDESANQFLATMGLLDFLVAAYLFIPYTFRGAIWYCIIWGTLTATARLVGNFYFHIPLESFHQFTYEMLYRLVHGGIPLLLWWNRE